MPASTVFELPTQNSLVKGFSPAQCREDNPPGSRCTSGCCSNCANPTCLFPRVSSRTGRPHTEFFVCDNKVVCLACYSYYQRHDVMRTTSKETISFHVAKCREENPPGSRCTSGCCSDCANPTCPFPRGALSQRRGVKQVTFKNVKGQIVCSTCAGWHGKHGTWRSEAAVSASQAAKSLKMSTVIHQMRARVKHQMQALEDLAYDPTKRGESVWCDLSSLLLLLDQKLSFDFDCVVF